MKFFGEFRLTCLFFDCSYNLFFFQMKWLIIFSLTILVAFVAGEGEVWEEDDHEVLIRNERGAKTGRKFFICLC